MRRRPAFFVPPEMVGNQNKGSKTSISGRIDLTILATAKKMGLSFQELNELRVCDYFELADIYTGENKGIRKATQEDIDKFYA